MVKKAAWRGAALAMVLLAGCAGDKHLGGTAEIGKVQGVFVEGYDGVFVDRQAAADGGHKPLWVYVTFDHQLADGRKFATATLSQDPGVEVGDLVQLRFAGDDLAVTNTPPAHNQVIALVAKHHTEAARTFGSDHVHALTELPRTTSDGTP